MWHRTEILSLGVGFAVWVLQIDGLRVPPFVAHDEGDGGLRALGLDPSSWRAWIAAIVHAEDSFLEFLSLHDIRTVSASQRDELARLDREREPPDLWAGTSSLRSAFDEIWPRYRPIGEDWAQRLTSAKRHSRISPRQDRRLWHELEPYHERLATLRIYPVDYVAPAVLALPPVSCVVAIADSDPDARTYVDSVIAAARELTASNGTVSSGSPSSNGT